MIILQKLIEFINEYVVKWYFNHQIQIHIRKWIFTIVKEVRAYIITYIYMKIHKKSCIDDYWNTDDIKSLHSKIIKHIKLVKWQQINRFFRTFKSRLKQNVFVKINDLNEHLRVSFKLYWIFDIHFTIDESIQRFMKRIDETINISSKSKLKKFKIWMLINFDYVLNWLYHVKNDKKNSIDLNSIYIKKWKVFKIQVVVFDLLQQNDISNDYQHIVWIDNLFTSIRFCFKINEIEFETVDTVRIIKMKRKEQKEKNDIKIQKTRKKNRDLNSSFANFKLKHEIFIKWNQLY